MQHGVILILTPLANIPHRLLRQDHNASLTSDRISRQPVRVLTLLSAEAHFIQGGEVEVKLKGEGSFKPAFLPRMVLEVRDLKHNVLERNHYLCKRCFTLTGIRLSHDHMVGTKQFMEVFRCGRCQWEWQLTSLGLLY